MAAEGNPDSEDGYSIGVVSRLTGINPETLRIWERRYNLTTPARAGLRRSRRYSEEDVKRLALVKALVDSGHPVSSVAHLSAGQLESRMSSATPKARPALRLAKNATRLIVLGESLTARLRAGESGLSGFEIVGAFASAIDFDGRVSALTPDIAVLEYASLQFDTVDHIRRHISASAVRHAVVIYGFAARSTLDALENAGVICLQQPVSLVEIQRACEVAIGASLGALPTSPAPPNGVPKRRFSTGQLTRIAQSAPSLKCECPHHLVELVTSLLAFETYSSECASLNERERKIHRVLHASTASARSLLEAALAQLIEFEGLKLD